MELSSRVLVQLLLLAYTAQVSVSQHWSYGWLPGGKRSVGEMEATFSMMNAGDAVMAVPADPNPHTLGRLRLYDVVNEEDSDMTLKRNRMPHKRRIVLD